MQKRLDFRQKSLYNKSKYVFGDEARCGYKFRILLSLRNSYGVCRGLDQGGKLQNKKHLSQDFHTRLLGLLYW